MTIITDTREVLPLDFPQTQGVEFEREMLPVGDYGMKINGRLDTIVCERKSINDLFKSFASDWDRERAKILKARDLGLQYHLAIEATVSEVREGHTYWQRGEQVQSKKSGIAQLRQLMTITHKYSVPLHFFTGRREMAWWMIEFFLARERMLKESCS